MTSSLSLATLLCAMEPASAAYAAPAWRALVCVVAPYLALAIFLIGLCARVIQWALAPVPFRIPTTCGQQRSLVWIKPNAIDNPYTGLAAVARMALEVLLFRSLFRGSRAMLNGKRYTYAESKALWLGALLFHWSLLIVVLRHLRLLVQPVPAFVSWIAALDGWMQIGMPALYMTDIALAAALCYLLYRRLQNPILRYLSRFADYFALLLLLSIVASGMLMRYVYRTDLVAVKRLALSLATFHPIIPAELNAIFLIHLLLVCMLAAYLPFSKLVHMGGVFLSPTRNLANNSRAQRHINPWNPEVKTHTYAEWEHEYHDKLLVAKIPLNEEMK